MSCAFLLIAALLISDNGPILPVKLIVTILLFIYFWGNEHERERESETEFDIKRMKSDLKRSFKLKQGC